MSNVETIPFSFNGNDLNVLQINDEPWFVAKEISSILDYRNASDAVRVLDEDEKGTHLMRTLGGNQEVLVINESGLYSLVLKSKKPEAKQFKRWVTHEVLPAIRKHGGYLTEKKTAELLANPDLIIELATSLKKERSKVKKLMIEVDTRNEIIDYQEQELKKQAPAVEYYREVLSSESTFTTNIIAKELGMSAITLNKILHRDYKLIYKQGKTWLPYSKFLPYGYTRTRTYTYTDSEGRTKTSIQLVWTEEGRRFIHGLFKLRK